MTEQTQPEALRLAEQLTEAMFAFAIGSNGYVLCEKAATELRKQHAENTRLLRTLISSEKENYQLREQVGERPALTDEQRREIGTRLPPSYNTGMLTTAPDSPTKVTLYFDNESEADAWFVAITDEYDAAHGIGDPT